jgi:hypothetical protein
MAPGRRAVQTIVGLRKRIIGISSSERNTCSLLAAESLAILKLDDDEFCGSGFDVFRKMDVTVTAPELACLDRGGLSGPIRKCEVEGLVCKEDSATGRMSVHDRFLAGTVVDSKEPHHLVLK